MVVTDQERSETFEKLLKDTLQNHITGSLKTAEHSKMIENETMTIICSISDIDLLEIVITSELDEILFYASEISCLQKIRT